MLIKWLQGQAMTSPAPVIKIEAVTLYLRSAPEFGFVALGEIRFGFPVG